MLKYLFPFFCVLDSIKDIDLEEQLTQVTESDDSETEEKLEQYFLDAVKKETRIKPAIDNITRYNYLEVKSREFEGTPFLPEWAFGMPA